MHEFDRKAASDTHILTVYPQPNGDGEVSLLHLKRAATDRFFLFRMTKPGVTLTGEMCLWEDETPIGTGLPMLFDFLDEVRISKQVRLSLRRHTDTYIFLTFPVDKIQNNIREAPIKAPEKREFYLA